MHPRHTGSEKWPPYGVERKGIPYISDKKRRPVAATCDLLKQESKERHGARSSHREIRQKHKIRRRSRSWVLRTTLI